MPVHELAITQSVVAQISERLPEARVVRVQLEIGRLSGVVADSVRFCFDLATGGTGLEDAELEIIETPGLATCRACQAEVELDSLLGACSCGSIDLAVIDGDRLEIKEVEVA